MIVGSCLAAPWVPGRVDAAVEGKAVGGGGGLGRRTGLRRPEVVRCVERVQQWG